MWASMDVVVKPVNGIKSHNSRPEKCCRIQEEPWALLCADLVGPLPRTAHSKTMLLVLFYNFSKWVELIPCRKARAEEVVKAIKERTVFRYGVPKALITYN